MKVVWSRRARHDIDEIADYIWQDDPVAARRVVLRVVDAIQQLSGFPEMGRRGRVAGTRELVLAGLPYVVAYRRYRGDVVVLRVIHAARDWPTTF